MEIDEQGVPLHPGLLEEGVQLAHVLIDVLDHRIDTGGFIVETAIQVRAVQFFRHIVKGSVGCVRRKVGETGLPRQLRAAHPCNGPVKEHVGTVALGRHGFPVVAQQGIGVAARVLRGFCRLCQSTTPAYQAFIEALIHGPHGIRISEVPFAKDSRGIAGIAQHFGNRFLRGVHHGPPPPGIDDPRPVVVPAGHGTGTRRRADRMHIEVFHLGRARGQSIDVRRPDRLVTHHTQVTYPHVVGQHHDDMGFFRCTPQGFQGTERYLGFAGMFTDSIAHLQNDGIAWLFPANRI